MFRLRITGLIATAAAVMFWAGIASAQAPQKMSGTAHDFSSFGWSGGEICVVCHTTHNGNQVNNAPLWNHALTSGNTYVLYDNTISSTMNATPGNPNAGAAGEGISTLCLSCHDGQVAVDSFGGNTGSVNISTFDKGGTRTAGYADVGVDLSDDHPIAIPYNSGVQGDMHDPSSTNVAQLGGGTINATMLFTGTVQCASCHDVHAGGAANTSLLIFDNAGSALCQTCHGK